MTRHGGRSERTAPGAFFGRRKGHALRPRQAALFDTLLPRLALDLAAPAPADLRTLFRRRRRRPAGNRLRRRRASDRRKPSAIRAPASSAASRSSTAWPRRWPRSRSASSPTSGCITATRPTCWPGCRRRRSPASICSIPIPGRSGGTGSGASCRTTASPRSRACCGRAANSASPPTLPDYAAWTLMRLVALARFRLDRGAGRRLAASRGRAFPARATRPRPSAKAARPAI